MHFGINERLFRDVYFNHPADLLYAGMPERLYGRFGEFFPCLVTVKNPFELIIFFGLLKVELYQ